MFGFQYKENFNYPYISNSITDFWRRWHISLSSWLRDYLYIPLGGSRCAPWRTYVNLLIVFLLCGLWHGASWNFVLWGLFYGLFLVCERRGLNHLLERCWVPLRHVYVLAVVMVGWVLFRADNLTQAMIYLRAMAGFGAAPGAEFHLGIYLDTGLLLTLGAACLGSIPFVPWLERRLMVAVTGRPGRPLVSTLLENGFALGRVSALTAVLLASAAVMLAATYNPFIYFRF
jgi:alginate O-acetyltransferase complex protein AlgI